MHLGIIGGGPGGYTAAFAAASLGWQVTVFEREALGGVCLNHGCIPTKTLRTSADAVSLISKLGSLGVEGVTGSAKINLEHLLARKNNVIHTLNEGLQKSFAAHKIKYIASEATLVKDSQGQAAVKANGETTSFDAIIIATGSAVLELPGMKFDHEYVCSSDDALTLKKLPKRLIVVGGGVIGSEMASIYRSFGCDVTIVEGQDRLLPLPSVDLDVSNLLGREFHKQKIHYHLGKTLTDVTVTGNEVKAKMVRSPFTKQPDNHAPDTELTADMILVTIGRSPVTQGLGLDEVGVACDKRGWITVDEHLATNVPNVYAIGDILGPSHVMLAHVASAEALAVIDTLAGKPHSVDYAHIPSAIFSDPEIGSVGLSEEEAKNKGYEVVSDSSLMRELGKAQAMNALPGFFKIVAEAKTHKILGVHIVGAHSSDLIAEAALAITNNLTLEDIVKTIHAHPTLAEGFLEAATKTLHKAKSA